MRMTRRQLRKLIREQTNIASLERQGMATLRRIIRSVIGEKDIKRAVGLLAGTDENPDLNAINIANWLVSPYNNYYDKITSQIRRAHPSLDAVMVDDKPRHYRRRPQEINRFRVAQEIAKMYGDDLIEYYIDYFIGPGNYASINEGWFSDAFDKIKGYFGASKEQDYDNRFKLKDNEKALLSHGLSRRDIENAMKQMMQQQASSSIEDIAIDTEGFLIGLLNNTPGNQMSFRAAEALVMQETDDLHYFQTQPDALRDMIEYYMPGIEIAINPSGPNAGQEIIRLGNYADE